MRAGSFTTFQDESDEFIQDDTLIADILVNISKPRRGAGITIPGNIPEQERPESPTLILDPKDKGKGIMMEEPKKKKLTLQQLRAAETANDEEVARKVAAEWEEEGERKRLAGLERLQAKLEDNEMIAAEVQRTEREKFLMTRTKRAKFVVEDIAASKEFRDSSTSRLRRSNLLPIPQLRKSDDEFLEGTAEVTSSYAQVNERYCTAEVHQGTAQVLEGTAEVHQGTDQVHEGTDEALEGTAEVHQEVEDEAGSSTFEDEFDEFIQDDTLIADILVNISKPRRGAGITIPGNIPEQERPESPTLILNPKDKGKGIMMEEPKKKKLTLQQLRAAAANDEEVARKVAAEWEEEGERKRLAGLERLQAELEDNEMIAAEVQRTERENFTEEQKAKFLVETIAAQRRFRAEQQAALRRSKPPTIPQLRNQMMKYIRNVGGTAEVHQGTAQVNEGTAEVNEGTAEVNESTAGANLSTEGTDEVLEGTAEVHQGTAQVNEGTAEVNQGTAQVNEGTAEVNEGTAEVNESTAGANLSTEPSMKEVEDEAGPSTFQDESDEFIQDDTLIADILVNISRPRRGAGITIPGNIPEQERPESPTLILDPKDKGKGIMKEEPKKKKLTLQQLRAAETANDEEVARKVAAEWEEEEERKRLAGLERLQAELEDNEMIAAEVQRTERENFTEEQKAKFLVETIAAQRRFRAEQQAALKRSKPPTIPQLRNQMMKYIRNVGGKAYRNLKNKNYEEISYEGTAQVNEGTAEVNEGTAEVNESTAGANLSTEPLMKEVER
ncbi:hypothetical protein Tco_0992101 [Tanacetum coccineum]|uniref:Uncharacterized protein n=1 Tax=Tanacetum coccineum TaxID=301880 RepID=A0ABQ5F1G0_9ASTR